MQVHQAAERPIAVPTAISTKLIAPTQAQAGVSEKSVLGIAPAIDVFGVALPVPVVAALLGAIAAAAFALANEWVKRFWLRSDRNRLLRAEYDYLAYHYAETSRMFASSTALSSLALERAKYRGDGLVSLDVAGFAALNAKTVRSALKVLNFVRNTDLQLDEAIKLLGPTDSLAGPAADHIKMRILSSLGYIEAAQGRLASNRLLNLGRPSPARFPRATDGTLDDDDEEH